MFRLRRLTPVLLASLPLVAFPQAGIGPYQVSKNMPTADSLGFAPIFSSGGTAGMTWDQTLRYNKAKKQLAAGDVLAKGPRYDARNPDSVSVGGCASAADPSYIADSTCAINYAFTQQRTQAAALTALGGGNIQPGCVYLPTGRYKVNGSIFMHAGECLIGDSKIGTVLTETDPNLAMIVYQPNLIANDAYVPYALIQGMTLSGNHTTLGSLIEADAGFLLMRDLNFYNSAGRGFQANDGERFYGENLSFYTVRWPLILSGDNNESTFIDIQGLTPGADHDSVAGSAYNTHCYSENCTNGVFPAANQGASGTATPLVVPSRGGIHIEKAVNVGFFGGDLKDNQFLGGIKNYAGQNVDVNTFYMECSDPYPWSCMTPAIIDGGRSEKTTITSTLTAGSYTKGGSTVNYHAATVADDSWMSSHYSTLANLQAGSDPHNYQPFVITPRDFNRNATTASTTCPGINVNQYEIVNSVHFYDATGTPMVLLFDTSRNAYPISGQPGGGVYNASTNPTGVPALYNWGACTTPPVLEDYMGTSGATMSVENIHSNTVQGGTLTSGAIVQSGYSYSAAVGSEFTPGEWIVGLTPDDSANGFYTPEQATGDPTSTMGLTELNIKQPVNMFNSSTNPYLGQITALRNANITIEGGTIAKDANVSEANAVTPLSNGAEQIALTYFTGGSHIVAAPNGLSTPGPSRLEVSAPSVGLTWNTSAGIFERHVAYFDNYQQTSGYTYGNQFYNDWQEFSGFGGTSNRPNARLHCHGYPATDTPYCSMDFGRDTGAWTSTLYVNPAYSKFTTQLNVMGFLKAQGGVSLPTTTVTTSGSLASAGYEYLVQATSGALSEALPACPFTLPSGGTSQGQQLRIVKDDSTSNAVTLTTTAGDLIYLNGASSSSVALSTPGQHIDLSCATDSNWHAGNSLASSSSGSYVPLDGSTAMTGGLQTPSITTTGTASGDIALQGGTGNIAALPANSAGFAGPATGGTAYLFKLPASAIAGLLWSGAPATAEGVNEAAVSMIAPGTSGQPLLSTGAGLAPQFAYPTSYPSLNLTNTADGTFSVGTAGTAGYFVVNPTTGCFGSLITTGSYVGICNSGTVPTGWAALYGVYNGIGIRGTSNNTATAIFVVKTSTETGQGVGSTAFTINDSNAVFTKNSTLDDGSGKATMASVNGTFNGSVTTTDAASVAVPITKRQSYIALTANTTFTIAAGLDGQEITMVWAQNAATAYTVTAPSNVKGFFTVGTTLSKLNAQHFSYSTAAAAWIADSVGVTNE